MTPDTSRMQWMDLLRGFAVILVVIYHASDSAAMPDTLDGFNAAVSDYRLPSLFVASGLILERSLRKGPGPYFSGKWRRLLWPYLLWSVVMLAFLGWERGADWHWWVYPRGSHTWFLIALAAIYVAAYAVRWVPPWVLAAVFFGASQVIDRDAFTLGPFAYDVAWYGTFFFAGAMLARHLSRWVGAPVWVFAVAAVGTLVWSWVQTQPDPPFGRGWLAALMTVVGVASIVWVLARLPMVWPLTVVARIGRRSVVLYLIHLPILKIALLEVGVPNTNLSLLLVVAGTVLVGLVLSRHYDRVRWLFEWPSARPHGRGLGVSAPREATRQRADGR